MYTISSVTIPYRQAEHVDQEKDLNVTLLLWQQCRKGWCFKAYHIVENHLYTKNQIILLTKSKQTFSWKIVVLAAKLFDGNRQITEFTNLNCLKSLFLFLQRSKFRTFKNLETSCKRKSGQTYNLILETFSSGFNWHKFIWNRWDSLRALLPSR